MTEKEVKEYPVEPGKRQFYVRLDDAKANLSPPGSGCRWFRKVPVNLFFEHPDDTTATLEPVILDRVECADTHNMEIIAALFDLFKDDCSTVSLNQAVTSLQKMGLTGSGGGAGASSVRRAIESIFSLNGGKIAKPGLNNDFIELAVNEQGYKCLQRITA